MGIIENKQYPPEYIQRSTKGVANMCEIMEEFGLERENEGLQKGIEYVAKALLSDGNSVEYVVKMTNLTPEAVEKLKQEI